MLAVAVMLIVMGLLSQSDVVCCLLELLTCLVYVECLELVDFVLSE